MDRRLRGIDHLLVGVRDLDRAARTYAELGFAVTPRGRHVGWPTGNHCVMLEEGYLELLGRIASGGERHRLDRFLAAGEGGLGIALLSEDPEATAVAWRQAGLRAEGPVPLARRLEDAAGTELRFRNVMLDPESLEGLLCFACHHETPERLRRPQWLAHANGARRLASCTVVAFDPEPLARVFERISGRSSRTDTDQVVAFQTGGAPILLAPPEDALLLHPALEDLAFDGSPRLAVATIEVADPEASRAWLESRGHSLRRLADGYGLAPREAHGIALEFVGGR